ncbi:MAG: hypothetical protein Q8881_03820 [Sweet potato little leaf phytoplasma]|nr:hypothetical protein [Sweet potato little leaf phytoplasma]
MGLWVSHSRMFPPNIASGDVSDKMAESISPNFALGDVSDETAESIPPNFHRISHSKQSNQYKKIYLTLIEFLIVLFVVK